MKRIIILTIIVCCVALLVVLSLMAFSSYQAKDKWPPIRNYPGAQDIQTTVAGNQKTISYRVEGVGDKKTVILTIKFGLNRAGWMDRFSRATGKINKVLIDKRFFGLVCDLYQFEDNITQAQLTAPIFVELKITKLSCDKQP